jgi:arsenate reductase-like glutaredoxin family protein
VFGTRKSADTRKALRFFSERRIRTHFVDVNEKPPSPGELRRFVERFGVHALIDRESRRFTELGLGHTVRSDEWWANRLTEEPLMLRMPLVRSGQRLTVGPAEATWRGWAAGAKRGG